MEGSEGSVRSYSQPKENLGSITSRSRENHVSRALNILFLFLVNLWDARHGLLDSANITFETTTACVCLQTCSCAVGLLLNYFLLSLCDKVAEGNRLATSCSNTTDNAECYLVWQLIATCLLSSTSQHHVIHT